MRKMITLIAVAALAASPFAFAEENNSNPNDVLQTVPGQGPTVAENTAAPAAPAEASAGDSAASGSADQAPAKPKHHKHHVKKHHHKHHHKAATAPSSDSHMSKEEPTSGSGSDMSAPAASTGQ
jgi:hypothetical protein